MLARTWPADLAGLVYRSEILIPNNQRLLRAQNMVALPNTHLILIQVTQKINSYSQIISSCQGRVPPDLAHLQYLRSQKSSKAISSQSGTRIVETKARARSWRTTASQRRNSGGRWSPRTSSSKIIRRLGLTGPQIGTILSADSSSLWIPQAPHSKRSTSNSSWERSRRRCLTIRLRLLSRHL